MHRLLSFLNSFLTPRFDAYLIHPILLAHINNAANAVPSLHIRERLVNLIQRLPVRNEFIDLQVAVHIIVHQPRQLRAALDTAKRAALPHTSGNELERARSNLLPSGRNTDDDALAPALVARLERRAHHVDVAGTVERVVAAAVGHLDELLLNALVAELRWVDKVGGAKLLGPFLLCIVDVDDNDLAGLVLDRALNDGETDAACAEDSDVGASFEAAFACGDDGGAVAGCDAAAEQAGAVHGRFVGDGDDRDVGYDGVLREG
jgi:hypothetical protein